MYAPGDFAQVIEHVRELRGYARDLGTDLATFRGCRRCRTQPQGQRNEALLCAGMGSERPEQHRGGHMGQKQTDRQGHHTLTATKHVTRRDVRVHHGTQIV